MPRTDSELVREVARLLNDRGLDTNGHFGQGGPVVEVWLSPERGLVCGVNAGTWGCSVMDDSDDFVENIGESDLPPTGYDPVAVADFIERTCREAREKGLDWSPG